MRALIAAISCHQYLYPKHDEGAAHHSGENKLRANAIRETWYKTWLSQYQDKIDLKFFYGKGLSEPENSVILDCPDDYYSLPLKVQKTFQWALDQGYDFVLKVDDDVFVYLDRLLSNLPSTDYEGYIVECATGKYCSGTAYWLSREAMRIVAGSDWNKENWAEDVWVGNCLRNRGLFPYHDERLHCCDCAICLKAFPESKRITSHTRCPERLYELFSVL